jgi:hypothetical protein
MRPCAPALRPIWQHRQRHSSVVVDWDQVRPSPPHTEPLKQLTEQPRRREDQGPAFPRRRLPALRCRSYSAIRASEHVEPSDLERAPTSRVVDQTHQREAAQEAQPNKNWIAGSARSTSRSSAARRSLDLRHKWSALVGAAAERFSGYSSQLWFPKRPTSSMKCVAPAAPNVFCPLLSRIRGEDLFKPVCS